MAAMAVVGSFPEDIEREILLRLPVKSLLRFKSVCKNWYALIKSPTFIKHHLNRSKLQIMICDFYEKDKSSSLITFISDENVESPDCPRKFKNIIDVVGSIDGLFLLHQRGSYGRDVRLRLWNPATREVRPLPAISPELQPPPLETDHVNDVQMLGFGLDPSTNDYKVVWIRELIDVIDSRVIFGTYSVVYSCSTDSSWRILENPLDRTRFSGFPGIYRNGFYYWLFQGEHAYNIISFDFVNEVFEEIGGPDLTFPCRVDLSLYEDSVAIFARDPQIEGANDFWVMVQPGVWNKLHTFSFPFFPIRLSRYCYIWDSRTVIFEDDFFNMITYDLKTQETRDVTFYKKSYYCSFFYYKESLVTVKPENGEFNDWDIFDSSI